MAVSRAHGVVCFLALSFGILTASGVYERGSSRDGGARARAVCIGSVRTRSSREVRFIGTAVTSSAHASPSRLREWIRRYLLLHRTSSRGHQYFVASLLRTLTVASLWSVPTVLPTNGTLVFCAPHPTAATAPAAHAPPAQAAASGCTHLSPPINRGSWSIQHPTKSSAVLLPVRQSYPFLPRYSTAENKSQSMFESPLASARARYFGGVMVTHTSCHAARGGTLPVIFGEFAEQHLALDLSVHQL